MDLSVKEELGDIHYTLNSRILSRKTILSDLSNQETVQNGAEWLV